MEVQGKETIEQWLETKEFQCNILPWAESAKVEKVIHV